MSIFRLVGNDTIKINQRIIVDLPHAEVAKVTFSSDLVTVKTGKNQNSIFSKNESGNQATLELKLLRGSADDKFMNGLRAQYEADPVNFTLINAELTKAIGKGDGSSNADSYVLTGGVISKNPEVVSNVEGDVEQAVVVWNLQFAYSTRVIA